MQSYGEHNINLISAIIITQGRNEIKDTKYKDTIKTRKPLYERKCVFQNKAALLHSCGSVFQCGQVAKSHILAAGLDSLISNLFTACSG